MRCLLKTYASYILDPRPIGEYGFKQKTGMIRNYYTLNGIQIYDPETMKDLSNAEVFDKVMEKFATKK